MPSSTPKTPRRKAGVSSASTTPLASGSDSPRSPGGGGGGGGGPSGSLPTKSRLAQSASPSSSAHASPSSWALSPSSRSAAARSQHLLPREAETTSHRKLRTALRDHCRARRQWDAAVRYDGAGALADLTLAASRLDDVLARSSGGGAADLAWQRRCDDLTEAIGNVERARRTLSDVLLRMDKPLERLLRACDAVEAVLLESCGGPSKETTSASYSSSAHYTVWSASSPYLTRGRDEVAGEGKSGVGVRDSTLGPIAMAEGIDRAFERPMWFSWTLERFVDETRRATQEVELQTWVLRSWAERAMRYGCAPGAPEDEEADVEAAKRGAPLRGQWGAAGRWAGEELATTRRGLVGRLEDEDEAEEPDEEEGDGESGARQPGSDRGPNATSSRARQGRRRRRQRAETREAALLEWSSLRHVADSNDAARSSARAAVALGSGHAGSAAGEGYEDRYGRDETDDDADDGASWLERICEVEVARWHDESG